MLESPVPIIYEDNHLLVIDKPAGLLSLPDSSGEADVLSLLKAYLVKRDHKPGQAWLATVHNLDQPVSGVMVLAKTSKAASRLSLEIRERRFDKQYLAVVHGLLEPPEAVWRDVLLKDSNSNLSFMVDSTVKGGKRSELSYRLLQYNSSGKMCLCAIDLITGRSHQIRVQFAGHGHALWGDHRYGTEADSRGQTDIALRSWQIKVKHPTQEEDMHFTAPWPQAEPWQRFQRP